MNYNYKLFDENGLIIDGKETPVSKGNNKVDVYYFSFEGHDYNDTYATVSVTLPDGESLIGELPTSNKDFTFKEKEYRGFSLLFLDTLTSQAGNLSLTINLKRHSDDRILCSSPVSVKIYDSDVSTEPTITEAQYEQILEVIDTNYKTLDDNKLYKDFSKYSTTTVTSEDDTIAINQSGVVKNTKLSDVYNIKSVNGITPVDKEITITSANIPHNETSLHAEINTINEKISEKVNIADGVFHREGTLVPSDYEPTGILNHTTDQANDGTAWARLILNDTNTFNKGDIIYVNFRLDLQDVDVAGGDWAYIPFMCMVTGEDIETDILVPAHQLGNIKAKLNGYFIGNILSFSIVPYDNDITSTPSIVNSLIRR